MEPLRLLVGPGHRLGGTEEVALSQVAEEPFVMIKPTSLLRRQCEQMCVEAQFEPYVAFVADDLPPCGDMSQRAWTWPSHPPCGVGRSRHPWRVCTCWR